MKNIYLAMIIVTAISSSTVMGQENRSFAEISVGTQVAEQQFMSETVKGFHGANISLEVGHDFEGLSASIYFGYFSNDWSGKHQASTHYYANNNPDVSQKVIYDQVVVKTDDRLSSVAAFSLMANVSYDVLRFIKGNSRHHLRPRVGLGYSHFGASSFFYSLQSNSPVVNSDDGIISDLNVNSAKTSNSGFEWSLGIGYDFSITRDWSIGVNYEKFMNIRGQQLVSLRARYAF